MTDSFYQGSAKYNRSGFKRMGTPANTSKKLEEEWKLLEGVHRDANKSYEWVSSLQTQNENTWLKWANSMGQREADQVSALSTKLGKLIDGPISDTVLYNFKQDLKEGRRKVKEKGAQAFAQETGITNELRMLSTRDTEYAKEGERLEKIHGRDFADAFKAANRGERIGMKIEVLHQHQARLPTLIANAIKTEEDAAKAGNPIEYTAADGSKYTYSMTHDNANYDRDWHNKQLDKFEFDAALAVPGKPLSANVVALAYGDKAYDTIEGILNANDVQRKSVRAQDRVTSAWMGLKQAIEEPHKWPLDKRLAGYLSQTAPEFPYIVGTDSDKKNQWVRAWSDLKGRLEDYIKNSSNPKVAGEAVAKALRDHNICGHPAGGGEGGCAKALVLFGEDFNPRRFSELGREERNKQQRAKIAGEQLDAQHAMDNDGQDGEAKGVLIQAKEASEQGQPWSEAKLLDEQLKLEKKYPHAVETVRNRFSKFMAPKMSPNRAYEYLADLGENNSMEFKEVELARVPDLTWEMYKGANPEARIVDQYVGENVPDHVKKIDNLIDEQITTKRGNTYIEGSRKKSKWHDDSYAVQKIFRRNVFTEARRLKDLDAEERPTAPRSDMVLLDLAYASELEKFEAANDSGTKLELRQNSPYYMERGKGYQKAREMENSRLSQGSSGLQLIKSIQDDNQELTYGQLFSTRQIEDETLLESKDYDKDGKKELAHPTVIAAAIASKLPVIEFVQKERAHADLEKLETDAELESTLAINNLFGDFGSEKWFDDFSEERNVKDYQAIGNYSWMATARANEKVAKLAGNLDENWAKGLSQDLEFQVPAKKDVNWGEAMAMVQELHPGDYELQIRKLVEFVYEGQQPDTIFAIGTEFINNYHSR